MFVKGIYLAGLIIFCCDLMHANSVTNESHKLNTVSNFTTLYTTPQVEIEEARRIYHQASSLFDEASNPERTIELFLKANAIFLKYHAEKFLIADSYYKIGVSYVDLGQYSNAIVELKKAKSLRRELSMPFNEEGFQLYVTLGDVFQDIYEYDSSEYYYNYVEQNIIHLPGLKPNHYHRLYAALGTHHYLAGDYNLALNYHQRALDAGLKVYPISSEPIVRVNNNIAAALRKLERYKEAIKIYCSLIPYNKSLPIVFQNLGKVYQDAKLYDSSLFYLKKAELIAGENEVLKIKLFNNIGITYTNLGDFNNALLYVDKAIDLNESVYHSKNAALAYAHMSRGNIYQKENQLLKALKEYQLALTLLHFNFNDLNIYSTPSNLDNLVSVLYFFECLKYKAECLRLYYQKTRQIKDLRASFVTYQAAIGLITKIRRSYSLQDTKLFFNYTVQPIYEGAIEAAFILGFLTQQKEYNNHAFYFSEKSKLSVLLESVNHTKIKKASGLPRDLIMQEEKFRSDITALYQNLANARDSSAIVSLKERLANTEIELVKVIRLFDRNEKYYKLKYDDYIDSVTMVQRKLTKETVLIEYFLGLHNLYIFTITPSDFSVIKIPLPTSFPSLLKKYRSSLYEYLDGEKFSGNSFSYELYKYLIGPVKSKLNGKKKLVIIPDAELNYIPFEALRMAATSNNYLINNYSISYAFSGASISTLQQQHNQVKHSISALAMAPFANTTISNSALKVLPASKNEINTIKGDHYIDATATKNQFIKKANSVDILHLATHAQTYNDDPLKSFIAFYPSTNKELDYKLYMSEVYNLDLSKVKLVVISACEVANGKLMKGEGIINLSRSFAYAGCTSMITSLWKADDGASSFIMESMYKYLNDGYGKDEALRFAKLDYLNSPEIDQRFKTPVYWANFILAGDSAPLFSTTVFNIRFWTVVALIILSIIIYYFLRVAIFNRA